MFRGGPKLAKKRKVRPELTQQKKTFHPRLVKSKKGDYARENDSIMWEIMKRRKTSQQQKVTAIRR